MRVLPICCYQANGLLLFTTTTIVDNAFHSLRSSSHRYPNSTAVLVKQHSGTRNETDAKNFAMTTAKPSSSSPRTLRSSRRSHSPRSAPALATPHLDPRAYIKHLPSAVVVCSASVRAGSGQLTIGNIVNGYLFLTTGNSMRSHARTLQKLGRKVHTRLDKHSISIILPR